MLYLLLKPGRHRLDYAGGVERSPCSVQEGDKTLPCPARSQVAQLKSLALDGHELPAEPSTASREH